MSEGDCKKARQGDRGTGRGVFMFDVEWGPGSGQVCAPASFSAEEVLAELPKPLPHVRAMGYGPWMISIERPRPRPCPHKSSRRHWSIES